MTDKRRESPEWENFCKTDPPQPPKILNEYGIAETTHKKRNALKKLMDVSMDFDPRNLNPKEWVAEGYFLKRNVTVIAGAGSVGKSLYSVGCAVSLALGISLGDMKPTHPQNVLMYALEDDKDELQSRISAFLSSRGRSVEEIKDKLSIVTLNENALDASGDLFTIQNRQAIPTQSLGELLERLDKFLGTSKQIDVVFIDPYAELHNGDENDNTVQAAIIGKLKQIARQYSCSVVIVHHSRKDAVNCKSASAVRGASAIINAARIVLIATTMGAEDMALYSVKTDKERESFLSLRRAKSNYAPNGHTEWFKKEVARLDQENGEIFKSPYVMPVDLKEDPLDRDPKFLDFMNEVMQGVGQNDLNKQPYSTAPNARETNLKPLLVKYGYENIRCQVEAALLSYGFEKAQFRNRSRTIQVGWRGGNGAPHDVKWVS